MENRLVQVQVQVQVIEDNDLVILNDSLSTLLQSSNRRRSIIDLAFPYLAALCSLLVETQVE